MPKNPPRPRTTADDVNEAVADTRRFMRRHATSVIYLSVGAVSVGVLVLSDYFASGIYALGYIAAGVALLADELTRGR